MPKLSIANAFELTLAQLAIASNIIVAKVLIQHFPNMLLLGLRFSISASLLFLITYYTRQKRLSIPQKLSYSDWLTLTIQALCAGFLFNFFMVHGLRYTTAIEAGIITSTIPAIIALLSYLLLKEKIGKHRTIAIAVAVLGLLIINISKEEMPGYQLSLFGNLLVFLAVIPESLFTVIAKWHGNKLAPLQMARTVVSINAVILLPFLFFYIPQTNFNEFQLWHFALLFLYGMLDSLFYIFWYRGLRGATASIAALFTAAMPIGVTILAWGLLSETMEIFDLIGMILVIFSILLGSGFLQKLTSRKFAPK